PLPPAPRTVHRPGGGAGARRPVLHPPADRRPHPRRPGDDLARHAAVGRHDRVGVQQPRLRAAVLGARRRRRGRPRPPPATPPRLRVPAAAETPPGPRPLAAPAPPTTAPRAPR